MCVVFISVVVTYLFISVAFNYLFSYVRSMYYLRGIDSFIHLFMYYVCIDSFRVWARPGWWHCGAQIGGRPLCGLSKSGFISVFFRASDLKDFGL
jgi:hypothetical protein